MPSLLCAQLTLHRGRTKSAAIIQSMAKTTATIIADNMINGLYLFCTNGTSKALSYAYGREEEGIVLGDIEVWLV